MSVESPSRPCYSEFGWRSPDARREARRIAARFHHPNPPCPFVAVLRAPMLHDATRDRERTVRLPTRAARRRVAPQAFAKYPQRGNSTLPDATRNVTNSAGYARSRRRPNQLGCRLGGPAPSPPARSTQPVPRLESAGSGLFGQICSRPESPPRQQPKIGHCPNLDSTP
jgi:hypothetical protein